jgi:tetratricopeptide (TPR) repeat protein
MRLNYYSLAQPTFGPSPKLPGDPGVHYMEVVMLRSSRVLTLVSCLMASSIHAQTADVTTELRLGVDAYEKSNFEKAIKYLEDVVSIDPASTVGHFYLGRTYDDWQCSTPNGCDTHWSGRVIQEYSRVLELDPAHKDALKCLAYFLYQSARFDAAEAFYRKAAKLDGNDPEALYSIAVLDFHRANRVLIEEKSRLRLAWKQPLIGLPACNQVRAKILADVEEGIAMLTGTAELMNDIDAQAHLGMLYRERAELQCGDRLAYKRDLKSESQWWNRVCISYHDPKRVFRPRWIPGPPPPPPMRGNSCKW